MPADYNADWSPSQSFGQILFGQRLLVSAGRVRRFYSGIDRREPPLSGGINSRVKFGEDSVAASRKNRKLWIVVGSLGAVVVLIVGIGIVRIAKGDPIDPNRLAKVTRGDVAKSVVATGDIQPITKVEVKSKASGIVEKLYVDINDRVHKGQELAQLDQQEIEAQVDAARAQLASAEANVVTYEANIEQDKVNAAAPDLSMYKATLDRNMEMNKEGIVSRQALDDANRDYLAELTKRDSAKAQIGVDTAKLKQARAQVQQSQASLKQLEEQLVYDDCCADGWRDFIPRR